MTSPHMILNDCANSGPTTNSGPILDAEKALKGDKTEAQSTLSLDLSGCVWKLLLSRSVWKLLYCLKNRTPRRLLANFEKTC